jgi:hypothetical protein
MRRRELKPGREAQGKTPNTKYQTANKFQTPNNRASTAPERDSTRIYGDWSLVLGVYLVFDVWCLVFRQPPLLPIV